MPDFDIDKWSVRNLTDYHRRGRLNVKPPYQRGRAWTDEMRLSLIDTVLSDYPMGVILLSEFRDDDAAKWDTVDGQQRCTTLVEYVEGVNDWTSPTTAPDSYSRFEDLSESVQDRFLDYEIPVAKLRNYSDEQIRDIFVRIQYGRALSVGEKIKALNSLYRPFIEELSEHKLFNDWEAPLKKRETHWALATAFFQAAYKQRPLERQEYRLLEKFLRDGALYSESKAKRAMGDTKWTLNFAHRVLVEAIGYEPSFRKEIANQRLLKWLMPSLMLMRPAFGLPGKEPDVAKGLLAYWNAKSRQGTDEYNAAFLTLRSGRVDTDEVRACLEQLMNSVINEASLQPLDAQRFFSPDQRLQILERAGRKCQGAIEGRVCGATLSGTNFHADHITPYAAGGRTVVENGQALCSACNHRKGKSSAYADLFAH